jgi:IclR family acetate operon transcriptional repressor
MSLDQRYIVTPLRKAMQLLDELSAADRPIRLSELAERTALPKTTAFRYLYTLRVGGFVAQDPETDAYTTGPKLAHQRVRSIFVEALKAAAVPAMQHLQRRFNETVNLAVLEDGQVLYVDMVGSTRSLRLVAGIGTYDPLHSTALGKALLSVMPDERSQAILPRRLVARTPNTITTRAGLRNEIAAIRARGYALDLEENEVGAHCVAVAVRKRAGLASVAAISVSGPVQRLPPPMLARIGAVLSSEVAVIALKLEEAAIEA